MCCSRDSWYHFGSCTKWTDVYADSSLHSLLEHGHSLGRKQGQVGHPHQAVGAILPVREVYVSCVCNTRSNIYLVIRIRYNNEELVSAKLRYVSRTREGMRPIPVIVKSPRKPSLRTTTTTDGLPYRFLFESRLQPKSPAYPGCADL